MNPPIAMVRTRMPGDVGGKAREGLPIPIYNKSTLERFNHDKRT